MAGKDKPKSKAAKASSGGAAALKALVEDALASFNILFERPAVDGWLELELGPFESKPFLLALRSALISMADDLALLKSEPSSACRLASMLCGSADSISQLNELARICQGKGLRPQLETSLLESVKNAPAASADAAALVKHAQSLARILSHLIPDYVALLKALLPSESASKTPRLLPSAAALSAAGSAFASEAALDLSQLSIRSASSDPFSAGRVFRHCAGQFIPVQLNSIRSIKDFYGYNAARQRFLSSFKAFAEGRFNLPMLITSLPGLGKTHFTIAYSLHFESLTLILPEPGDLERPLEGMLKTLSERSDRKFVLFFDDVDTRALDWYFFRTNVGGSFALPSNITIAIASNYQFPANISSRGVGFSFPIFDEIRCQEMVHDFLISLGMKQPPQELVSVISADYVEEFGQKLFEELSPRTLVRYLDRYQSDASKRVRMLDLSKGDVISRPDSQVFFETNVKLMKSLYGDDALDEFRKRQLDGAKGS